MIKFLKHKVLLKLTKGSGRSSTYRPKTFVRFRRLIEASNWRKAYVWVGYGKEKDNNGKISEFYNDADFVQGEQEEAIQTLKAFLEL